MNNYYFVLGKFDEGDGKKRDSEEQRGQRHYPMTNSYLATILSLTEIPVKLIQFSCISISMLSV